MTQSRPMRLHSKSSLPPSYKSSTLGPSLAELFPPPSPSPCLTLGLSTQGLLPVAFPSLVWKPLGFYRLRLHHPALELPLRGLATSIDYVPLRYSQVMLTMVAPK
jgi:hypothetical protein